jgi:putative N6-adenine-specific DNA methylase
VPNSPEITLLTPRALERRLKRRFRSPQHSFFAACQPGFEDLLLAEVRDLPGVASAEQVTGGVEFSGPIELMYHANLQLNTAHRVLLRIASFLAQSGPALFGHIRRVAWEHYLGFEPHYALHVTSRASKLNHYGKMRSTISSGISAVLEPLGLRPALADVAAVQFYVRLEDDRATVSVNTSGEHLHRRGWRTHVGRAPLRETLAAAMLLRAGLHRRSLIIDPLCGSGTLLLEAARIRRGLPAGAGRSFAFEHLPFFNASQWERLRRDALGKAAAAAPDDAIYLGSDSDAAAVAAAEANRAALGLAGNLSFRQLDAFSPDLLPAGQAAGANGLLVTNLPYGQRLQGSAAAPGRGRALLGDLLQHVSSLGFSGDALVLCSADQDPGSRPGVKITGSTATSNGGLPVILVSAKLAPAADQE